MGIIRDGIAGVMLCAFAAAANAATFFVAPGGRYDNSGSLQSPWNLRRAAEEAAAGDIVEMRGGTYPAVLHPRNGGTPASRLIFRAYAGESPLIAGAGPDDRPVEITTDYVTLEGLAVKKSVTGPGKQYNVLISGDHATVRDCTIVGSAPVEDRRAGASESGIRLVKPSYGAVIEGCEIAGLSHVGIHVGDGAGRVVIRRNDVYGNYLDAVRFDHSLGRLRESLVEDNELSGSLVSDGIQFNGDFRSPSYPDDESNCGTVIRRNLIHGNAENGIDLKGTCRIVIEQNAIYGNRGDNDGAFDSPPTCGSSSNDRCGGIGGITKGGRTTSRDVIIRRNVVYDNRGGIAILGDGWMVYGNTIVANNRDFTGPGSLFAANDKPYFVGLLLGGPYADVGVKNNLVGGHSDVELRASGAGVAADIDGNVYFHDRAPQFSYSTNPWAPLSFDAWRRDVSRWSRVLGDDAGSVAVAGPGLRNVPVAPVMGGDYDFALAPSSPAADAGVALTQTMTSGYGTTVPVENARYFSDGMQIVDGDTIRIDGTGIDVRVVGVDYAADRLVLDRPLSWDAGAGVHLAYSGTAPDAGAYENGANETGPAEAGSDDGQPIPLEPDCLAGSGDIPGCDAASAAGFVAASAVVDIYREDYGRFDFALTNDAASTVPIVGAMLTASGTEFDALDTSSALSVVPASLGSNNGVTTPTARVEFAAGLAPGSRATGRAGDLDPYAAPESLDIVVTFANGATLAGEFVRNGSQWSWSASSAAPAPVALTIQAEALDLNGYSVENGNRIRLTRSCCQGTAGMRFDGVPGRYDLTIFGVSETDGPARIDVRVNGAVLGQFTFGVVPAASQFVLPELALASGDLIEIVGTYGNGGFARIDRLTLEPRP